MKLRLKLVIFAAYGWISDLSDDEIMEKLLSLGPLRFASGVLRKFGEGEEGFQDFRKLSVYLWENER